MRRPVLQDPVFKFEDTAIVLFQTDYLNYQFVYAFNKAWRLSMVRVDDLEVTPLKPLKPLKPLEPLPTENENENRLPPNSQLSILTLRQAQGKPNFQFSIFNSQSPPLPCYLHHDEASRLTFVLIDTQTIDDTKPYNFLLLVRGRDAWDFQASLYHNLTDTIPEPDPTEIRQHIDWQLMREFKNNIFAVDTFCFSPQRGQSTSLPFSTQPSALRTRQSFLRRLHQLVAQTFQTLEWQLCE